MGRIALWWVAGLMLAGADLRAQSATPSSTAAPAVFEAAARAQQAGDFATAEAEYRKFLALQPRSVEALANLGVVYVNLGRYDDAIASYRKALDISYLNAPIRMNLGLAFYKAARYTEAIPEFDRVLAASPGTYNALLLKADCLLQLGRLKDAISLLEPVAADHADDAAFDYVMGMALLQDKQTDKGLVYLDRILKRGDSAEAHLLLGLAKQSASDFAEAREEFRKAVDLNGSLPAAHSLLGQAMLRTGDRDAAREAFERELALNPNDFESNLYLGVIEKEASDFAAARVHFDRAHALRPDDPGVQYQIASLLLASGDTTAALPRLEALVAANPDFVEAHVSLATAYYRMKRRADGDREKATVARLQTERAGSQGADGQGAGAPPSPQSEPPQ